MAIKSGKKAQSKSNSKVNSKVTSKVSKVPKKKAPAKPIKKAPVKKLKRVEEVEPQEVDGDISDEDNQIDVENLDLSESEQEVNLEEMDEIHTYKRNKKTKKADRKPKAKKVLGKKAPGKKAKNTPKYKLKKNRNLTDNIDHDNKILVVKTIQTGPFKQAIERISNVISDCSIVFVSQDNDKDDDGNEYNEEFDDQMEVPRSKIGSTKKNKKKSKIIKEEDEEDEEKEIEDNDVPRLDKFTNPKHKSTRKSKGGIRIVRLTEDKSILIKLNLDAECFEYFRCDEPKITIGVDMLQFHALLKTISDNNALMTYMNKDNRSALYIRSINENDENNEETDIEVYLMDIPNPDIHIPITKFQNWIIMAGDKFNNICKHLHNNSQYVEIASVNNEISFRGYSEGGKITL